MHGGIGIFAKGPVGSFMLIDELSVSSLTWHAIAAVNMEMMNISENASTSDIIVSNIPLPVLSGPWNIGATLSGDKFSVTKNPFYNNFINASYTLSNYCVNRI